MGNRMKKVSKIVYTIGILVFSLVLASGLLLEQDSFENEGSAAISGFGPAQRIDEAVSRRVLCRAKLIDLYTRFRVKVFASSPVDNVIVGKDGYLYYKDTVADHTGSGRLSDEEIKRIAERLSEYYEIIDDKTFIFVIAPNKNSLYDHMPGRYKKSTESSNAERLIKLLKEEYPQITAVDLFEMFRGQDDELYYRTDTHWNDEGALLVYKEIVKAAGHTAKAFEDMDKTVTGMTGDLQKMLYPDAKNNESRILYDTDFEYLTNTRSTEQNYIESYCETGEGSLVMYRDSFANNLVELFSDTYEYAVYDKSLPYDPKLVNVYDADTVVIEIAERNLKLLLE